MADQTISILIGNSDNKLSQSDWHFFVQDLRHQVRTECGDVHFDGLSSSDSQYQNACIVAVIENDSISSLYERLSVLARAYDQESIAVVQGQPHFVEASND